MTKIKTRTKKTAVHFRCEPCDLKRLCNIATAERRSIANLVEKIIADYLANKPEAVVARIKEELAQR